MKLLELRNNYHRRICQEVLRISRRNGKDYANYSDVDSRASVLLGLKIIEELKYPVSAGTVSEQTRGNLFEDITSEYIEQCFQLLAHLRPGEWIYSTTKTEISNFAQYEHLKSIEEKVKTDKDLSSTLGTDYIVKPDIIVARTPVSDEKINECGAILDENDNISKLTNLRKSNAPKAPLRILHASISCKWTIRSDRSQNTRTEALNLIRNRKGNLPHVVAVIAEPLPTRIAALALGTGDLDCVYHFALHELRKAIIDLDNEDQKDILDIMVNGGRLRDISDLPFDLAV